MRSYNDEATDFHIQKIPKSGSNYICWSVILMDSVFKKDENDFPQVFLKAWKSSKKMRKVIRYIPDELKFSCHDFDEFEEEYIKTKHHDGDYFLNKANLYMQNVFLRLKIQILRHSNGRRVRHKIYVWCIF